MKTADCIVAGGRQIPCAVPVVQWSQHGMSFPGAKSRRRTELLTLHWTGSENPAATLFANMRKRGVSVHLFVDNTGLAWQFNDCDAFLAHAKGMNERAVGIEIANRANGNPVGPPKRALIKEIILGKEVVYTQFTAEQRRSALALCAAVCEAYALPWQVPMEPKPVTMDGSVPRSIALPNGLSAESGSNARVKRVIPRKLTAAEFAAHRGVIGHFHWSDEGKTDPGIALLEAVAAFKVRHAQGIGGPAE